MKEKKKYTIEITKEQYRLMEYVFEKFSRIMMGQLDYGLKDDMERAYEMTHDMPIYERQEDRMLLDQLLNEIKMLCFNQRPSTSNGVGYMKQADMLVDMVEVMRHYRYKEKGGTQKPTVDAYPAYHWEKTIPLIKIKPEI